MERISLLSTQDWVKEEPTFDWVKATKVFVSAIVFAWLLIVSIGVLIGPKIDTGFFGDKLIHYEKHVDFESVKPLSCVVEGWNNKSTTNFPFYELYQGFGKKGLTGGEGLGDGELRLISAFVYEEYIVVTHSAQNPENVGKRAFCHYYDCNRELLPEAMFESFVFPMTAVHCPRRAGAKYMSLTYDEKDIPQEPVPLINRIFKNPPHEIGVCVGQIYGEEKKWLEIIEYIEHHQMIGASMFYFTIYEMDGYTKRVIEDYERLGQIEASFVNTEYSKVNWLFHMIQVHECFFRSKFHSKWVINIDIDERMTMRQMPLATFLRQQPPEICEINFSTRRVQKLADMPDKYVSDSQTVAEMEFLRYNLTTSPGGWGAFKTIFKAEKIHATHFHWTWRQHDGCVVKSAGYRVGYIRHYRTVDSKSLSGDWRGKLRPYTITKLDPEFSQVLQKRVLQKVKFLYDQHPIYCSSIAETIRKHFVRDITCV